MKIVVHGPLRHLGVVQHDRVLDLPAAAASTGLADAGTSTLTSLGALVESGERGLDVVRELDRRFAGSDEAGLHVSLSSAQLHPPFPGRRFGLAGGNFAVHVANGFTNRGQPITADEVYARARQGAAGGFWAISAPVGPGADIPVPSAADGLFDYEGEVAVIVGKGGKGLKADSWREHVWGTTLVIDWSVRHRTNILSREPFYAQKNFDCSKSIGPWIAVDELDPNCTDIETYVNGDLRQRFNSRDMIYSFGEYLEQISRDLTLLPGDVLSGGTGPGTAGDASVVGTDGQLPLDLFLKVGDTVEVRSPGLGSLTGHIVERGALDQP